MRMQEICHINEGKGSDVLAKIGQFEPMIITPISNAATAATVTSVALSFGLPVIGGVAVSMGISAAVGLTIGGVIHYIKEKKRDFQKDYELFLVSLSKREVLKRPLKTLSGSFLADYKYAIREARRFNKADIKALGQRVIRHARRGSVNPPELESFKLRVRNAMDGGRMVNESFFDEALLIEESVVTAGLAIFRQIDSYIRKTGSTRTKNQLTAIEHSGKVTHKTGPLYKTLQGYVAWDFVEGRCDAKEYLTTTKYIQAALAEINKNKINK